MHSLNAFIAVDTETTGLDFEHDRMIELAAVRFEGGKPVADFQALLSPGRPLSPVSRLITGLTAEELEAAPPAADTLRAFLEFAGDLPLVAHNAEFDAHFVRRALETEKLPPLPGPWIDSLLMSRIAWPTWESHRLDSLAEQLRVPRDAEHRALPDARRAGFVFIAAQDFLRDRLSPGARADLARLSAELPDWSRVFTAGVAEVAAVAQPVADVAVATETPTSAESVSGVIGNPPAAWEKTVEAALEAISAEACWAVETPPEVDDHAAGLEAATRAAARGQRVLLCLPDNYAWNALRKSAGFRNLVSSARAIALAEPSGYLCRARLAALAAAPERLPVEERAALLPLIAWADQTDGALMADGRGFSPERARVLAARVTCDAYAEDPAALAARRTADSAGIILVTHATLCAHLRLEGALLPACDSLVVTGAHRLPETAQRALGREASFFRLRAALQAFHPFPEDATAREAWLEPERQFQKFLQKAGRQAVKRRPPGDSRVRYAESAALAFGVDPEPVFSALRTNESLLEGLAETSAPHEAAELRRVLARVRAFRLDFEWLCEAGDADRVYAFEDVANPHKALLRATPLDLESFGAKLVELFGAGAFLSPALLTGARGDGAWFFRALGLEPPAAEPRALGVKSAAPAPRFFMAPFAPGFSATEPAETFARFLVEAAQPFADRGIVVFFPSQGALRTVHGALKAVLPEGTPCWAQHVEGNRDAVLRLLASEKGGWVLTTEGIPGMKDAEGRAPALTLITRMPLPPAHDPVLEARAEGLQAQGRNARAELWVPAAILRLKKEWAAWRKTRTAETTAPVVWLLDARASAEGLGAQAARSLGSEPETFRDLASLTAATAAVLNP